MKIEIIKDNTLSNDTLIEIEHFLQNNNFNSGISFLENDMNYYEEFPCFYMLYEQNTLIAFTSVFIPDSASCEIYFHLADSYNDCICHIFKKLYEELKTDLYDYDLFNQYIIFDKNTTGLTNDVIKQLEFTFSHSECLMQYDITHSFDNMQATLLCEINSTKEKVTVMTYMSDEHIGTCEVEISGDYALIHDVEVIAKYRGQGFGKETLFHTISYLVNNNYKNILLHVNSANTIAFTMYSHYGFTIHQQLDYYKL